MWSFTFLAKVQGEIVVKLASSLLIFWSSASDLNPYSGLQGKARPGGVLLPRLL